MHSWPMHQAPRCRARSKRSGLQCRAPAVRGYAVCRMHGAGGAAPRGNRNAWKHGAHSAEALALKKQINTLARTAREAMAYGRPVVATGVGGLRDAIEDGVTGLVVPPREPAALRGAPPPSTRAPSS